MTEARLSPPHTALLLLDFQQAVLRTVADSSSLVDRAARGLSLARRFGARVSYVRAALTPKDRMAIPMRNKMFGRIAGTNFLAVNSIDAEIPAAIAPEGKELTVTKTRVSAFNGTYLHEDLRNGSVDTLILAGIHTSGVVLSTLRDAADLDYRILVLEDLCADPDAEVHHFLVNRIFPGQADVISLAALSRLLQR